MAEVTQGEVKPKEGEGTTVPETKTTEEHTEPQYTDIERQAMSQGWKPKDQWEGNPDEHRSAREFIDRGELLSKIRSQSEEIKKVTQIVGVLSDHNKKVYLAGYNRALAELKAQKVKALEDRDSAKVVELDDKIQDAKAAIAAVQSAPAADQQVQQGQVTPAFQSFMDRNPWYKEQATMRHWAHGMALEYAKVNPKATEAEVYEFIEKEVKKDFPGKFGTKPNGGLPPSPEGGGRETVRPAGKGAGSFEKLMARLPEEHARVAREMVKRGLVTKEKYVEDYERLEA